MIFPSFISRQHIFLVNRKFIKAVKELKQQVFLYNQIHSTANKENNENQVTYMWGSDSNLLNIVSEHFKLYENFISESEEENLMKEIDPIFKRRRYEFDHWDGAIQGYKETEKADWNEENSKIIQRLQKLAFPAECKTLKLVHVLDLSKDGYIKPHVDSVRFCGNIISGISLLSSSIMRLAMEENKEMFVDVLLQRQSLYIMSGLVRYKFTHEILKDSESFFKGIAVPRGRRVSVICRNEPEEKIKTDV
ncbi:alpha-ketoglutarate-dependent dioxygenase alkB homolog 7, mitochondrial-like isoform X1 [Argiope bruennichi]|uniref:alpha-ketoglutarate-dependent dioxygenase alkB homolog 7, mitochondrial-like isoform X1 n=1 Tax=Argiope bruennichi TaxID=94029 RepID=UPI0024951262|nr:alpha-ketoglutarate-dependent dioxygenase alkB homolog 7, mitochondrial-like isoform X1 [Argiope bruennichi]